MSINSSETTDVCESIQKQQPEVFCKKGVAQGLQLYYKRDSGTGVFL